MTQERSYISIDGDSIENLDEAIKYIAGGIGIKVHANCAASELPRIAQAIKKSQNLCFFEWISPTPIESNAQKVAHRKLLIDAANGSGNKNLLTLQMTIPESDSNVRMISDVDAPALLRENNAALQISYDPKTLSKDDLTDLMQRLPALYFTHHERTQDRADAAEFVAKLVGAAKHKGITVAVPDYLKTVFTDALQSHSNRLGDTLAQHMGAAKTLGVEVKLSAETKAALAPHMPQPSEKTVAGRVIKHRGSGTPTQR